MVSGMIVSGMVVSGMVVSGMVVSGMVVSGMVVGGVGECTGKWSGPSKKGRQMGKRRLVVVFFVTSLRSVPNAPSNGTHSSRDGRPSGGFPAPSSIVTERKKPLS